MSALLRLASRDRSGSTVIINLMNSKKLIWLLMIIGYTVGGYVPKLWGAGLFSFSSILFGALGAFLGIWLGFKLSR